MNRANDNEAVGREALNGCLLALVLSPFTAIARGICLSFMWEWFMAVPFELPHIGIAHAIGISCLYGTFTASAKKSDKDKLGTREVGVKAGAMLAVYCFMLLMARIISWCM